MQTIPVPAENLTARDPAEGMRLAETLARRLAGQAAATVPGTPDPAEYIRTLPPTADLAVLTAIQFGTIAAANNYWRKG